LKSSFSKLQTSKLFLLLAIIDEKALNKVPKFLGSPYFNTTKPVIALFQFISQLSHKKRGALTKEQLHQALYPTLPYKDERIRLVMSQLVQLLEQFLLLEEWKKNTVANKIQLAQLYQQMKVEKLYEQTNTTTFQQLQKQPLRNVDYYKHSYQLALANYQQASFTNRMGPQNLQEVANLLDTSYLIEKLKIACLVASHQRVYQQEYDFGLLDSLLVYITKKELTNIPAIGIYYYSYQSLVKEDPTESFQQFKKLLFQYQQQFTTAELMDIYLMGINCCIRMINKGDRRFLEESMDLYQKGLASNALLENGVLSRFTYQNIVSTGLRTQQYQWTEEFMETYKLTVEKEYQESAYRFNKGRVAYQQKHYQEALDLLKDTDHKDLLVNLFSKTLLLKIYYELEEFKLLDAFLDSFQIYLRRKKIIGYHKDNYKKIIYYTRQLMKVNPFDKSEKEALKNKIIGEENLLEKEWLLEQLELLH